MEGAIQMTMDINPQEITIRKLIEGYENSDDKEEDEGVRGYGGNLNIRPPYQREFVYSEPEEIAVINTVKSRYPLNVMYWAVNDDDTYEVLDGQQRILSICRYIDGKFTLPPEHKKFKTLLEPQRERILDYKLLVYFCKGNIEEKLDWFKTINIRGLKLEPQELRNAVYAEKGRWLTEAKRYFSKTNGPAYRVSKDYVTGRANRQEILETAIEWIAGNGDENIRKYMTEHQEDTNAEEIWLYFRDVINWIEETFIKKRIYMKGLDWGTFYRKHKDKNFNPEIIEEQIKHIVKLPDRVGIKKKGVYEYVLTGNERALISRIFSLDDKQGAYERQNRKCTECDKEFDFEEMQGDHIIPWIDGGATDDTNCQMLCNDCHKDKTAKQVKEMRIRWRTQNE